MLILPIGHEENTVRRMPVVTFSIMAICFLLFLFSGQGNYESEADLELSAQATEAIEYYLERPYLKLDDEFESLAYGEPDAVEDQFAEFSAAIGEFPPGTTANPQFAREQAELDRLTAVVLASRDAHLLFRWGLVPNDISAIGLLMHMFLHVGWLHLIGNLLILYLAGPFVEDLWGRPLFAAFYLVSGLAASFAHIAFNVQSDIPLIGASGAIAGVMGAFLIHFHRTKIRFFYLVAFYLRGTFDAAAWIMLPLWFGEQLFFAAIAGDSLSGVAYWAHIGGFGFGAAAALTIRGTGLLERWVQPALDQRIETTLVDRPGLDAALAAHEAGQFEESYQLLATELTRNPAQIDTAELYLESARDLDRSTEALPHVAESLEALLRTGDDDGALRLWGLMLEIDPTVRAAVPVLLRLSQLQARRFDHEHARETLRRALLHAGAAPAPALVFKIVRLGTKLDPTVARAALRALLGRDDLRAEDRTTAEAALVALPAAASTAESPATEESPEPIPLLTD